LENIKGGEMKTNTVKHNIPVKDYGILIYIKPLQPIDLSVVCEIAVVENRPANWMDDDK
jgi:hypothetical protein